MEIASRDELSAWMDERRRMGRDLIAIKGDAPAGSTYSDGDPIRHPVNIAWRDAQTGELFAIEYEIPAATWQRPKD